MGYADVRIADLRGVINLGRFEQVQVVIDRFIRRGIFGAQKNFTMQFPRSKPDQGGHIWSKHHEMAVQAEIEGRGSIP